MSVKYEVLNVLKIDYSICIGEIKEVTGCNIKSIQRVIKELCADHVVVSELCSPSCGCKYRYSLNPNITINELSKLGINVSIIPIKE